MTIRRIPASMLYGLNTSVEWLRAIASAMDEASADLCRSHWHGGPCPAPQPLYHKRAASNSVFSPPARRAATGA